MSRIVFSSDQLSPELAPTKRFAHWRELYCQQYGELEITAPDDFPFFGHIEATKVGSIGIGRMHANIKTTRRTMSHVRADGGDRYCLLTVVAGSLRVHDGGRESFLESGDAIVIDRSEECRCQSLDTDAAGIRWYTLSVPRNLLVTAVPSAADIVRSTQSSREREELRFIVGYMRLLLDEGGVSDARLRAHVGGTLLDLLALALGPKLPDRERAANPGLRAARLDAILADIRSRAFDPDYSVASAAGALKLSVRYIQEILQCTGLGFAERVLELRLQRALALLSNDGGRGLRISDVALACGFNDVSYFHRCFRRRFGLTPAAARGRAGS